MVKFTSKLFFIAFVLFFGILFGVYQASQGVMSGSQTAAVERESTEQPSDHSTNEPQAQEADKAAVDDVQASAHLKDKQQRLVEIESHNFFAELGSNLAELLKVTVVAILTVITSTINDLLN